MPWAVVLLAVAAAFWDVRWRRVPNALTLGAALAGLIAAGFHVGQVSVAGSALGWLVGLGLFLPLFAVGGLGGGDVKLLAAFGAWLGPVGVMWTALWAAIAGGVLAVAVGVVHGYLRQAFQNLGAILSVWRTVGPSSVRGLTLGDAPGPRLAYAVPISAAAVLVVWLHRT